MPAPSRLRDRLLAVAFACAAALAPVGGGIGPAAVTLAVNDKAPEVILIGEVAAEGVPLSDIVIAWDEIIDPNSIPVPADFTVTIGVDDFEPDAVEYLLAGLASDAVFNADGLSFVQLELPDGVTWSNADVVAVDYTPGATPIRDLGLGVAPAFVDLQPFAFDVGEDFTPIQPIVDSYYGADHLVLAYFHQIAAGPLPEASDFSVAVDGSPLEVVDVAHVAQDVGMGLLDLRLASPLTDPALPVNVSYTRTTNPIVSARNGAVAADFANVLVTVILAKTSASGTLAPGGTLTTAGPDGPTVADPMQVSLTSPIGGPVTLQEVTVAGDPPAGFGYFGRQLNITADPAASENAPLVLVFDIDASIVPDGQDHTTLVMFRNGVPIGSCTGPPGVADPDPCVSARATLVDGDVRITVLTTAASEWNVGVAVPFAFGGFEPPVDGAVPNILTAGRAVPVRFSLGGDRGLDIFAPGSPTVVLLTSCAGLPTGDPVEETVAAGGSSLTYDPETDTYTYVWKTQKSWAKSCRRLELAFSDGSSASAIFDFR